MQALDRQPTTRSHRGMRAVLLCAVTVALAPLATAAEAPDVIEAVKARDHRALTRLLEAGADVNVPQGDGSTALHWAAFRSDVEAVRRLLAAGADVNAPNDLGATPLWVATTSGHGGLVTALLSHGADPNLALTRGETTLMAAARAGSTDAVRQLLQHGAEVDTAERERHQTALMWAAAQGHDAVVRTLIAHGANLEQRSRIWHQLENTAGNTNGSGNVRLAHGGSTALHLAARNGHVETARALLSAGAEVDATTAAGTTALVIAAHSAHTPVGRLLLEHGADPTAQEGGYAAIHAAVLRGQAALVETLLDHGADPDAVVRQGTPGRRFSADYSIRHQAVGANALWLAAKYGELDILRTLAERGASAHVTPYSGESALQAAMGIPRISQENRRNQVGMPWPEPAEEERISLEMAKIVLDLGVDIDSRDGQGNTALHDAVRRGFARVIELLAVRGADLDAANDRGQTPVGLAESRLPIYGTNGLRQTQPELAELLRGLGAEG